jgi:hypothetical protein
MTIDEAVDILEYFEEKAAHLQGLTATHQAMKNFGAVVSWKKDQGWDSVFAGPEGEPIEAFVLTLRFFTINNEPISLHNMRNLYEKMSLSPEVVSQFKGQCNQLNEFLDSETGLSIEEERAMTYREVFSLFLNGSLAHGNDPRRRQTFREIRAGSFFPLFQAHFVESVRAFIVAMHFLRKINQQALGELRSREVDSV